MLNLYLLAIFFLQCIEMSILDENKIKIISNRFLISVMLNLIQRNNIVVVQTIKLFIDIT